MHIKTQFLIVRNLSKYINLLVLVVVLATLAKLVVILKLGLRSLSKRITSLIFLKKHALTHNFFCFKIIDNANSKFDLKIKEALHINWRKLNLNTQQSHLAIASVPRAPVCLCLFLFFYFLHFSFICRFHYLYSNYRYLLLS